MLITASFALVATGAAVSIGVAGSKPSADVVAVDGSTVGDIADRGPAVSRGGSRSAPELRARTLERTAKPQATRADRALLPQTVAAAIRKADTQLWTTTELNLWTRPDDRARQVGVLDSGKKVAVTGRAMLGRQEIVLAGEARWVTVGYLSDEKPDLGPSSGGQCTNGTSVPSSVSPNIQAIHQSVCANFPEIVTYGTLRPDGEHAQGIAMDIMVAGDRGWQVAEFLREYSSEFGVNYLIHAQRIWSVGRSAEGWRAMEDRGSVTANHYDHVHVTTY
ncbi:MULTISPECIES: hypothetical protein [unclassified Nocardioides]|uniref:hypothetical protein n=1 Tax=unclassified Nocardioides TaxID=2615069 RepID=UPI00105490F3|nr:MULTISPECIES: hypothetical protein [unclassified Nocardioides]